MSTIEPSNMREFENDLRFIEKGDLIFYWGRFSAFGWHFLGIPRTNIGVSYYVATGEEDDTQYERLARLVTKR